TAAGRRRGRAAVKVAIAGAGNVGTFIAADLYEAGHDVLVIEEDVDLVAKLRPTLPVTWFVGDACEVKSLHEAGLAGADVVVAATGDDEDNLVISLLAKQEFAVPRVVARVNHPKNHWLFDQAWGAAPGSSRTTLAYPLRARRGSPAPGWWARATPPKTPGSLNTLWGSTPPAPPPTS